MIIQITYKDKVCVWKHLNCMGLCNGIIQTSGYRQPSDVSVFINNTNSLWLILCIVSRGLLFPQREIPQLSKKSLLAAMMTSKFKCHLFIYTYDISHALYSIQRNTSPRKGKSVIKQQLISSKRDIISIDENESDPL